MTHLARKPPYWNTQRPAGHTKSDIDEMLKEFGAKAIRWTETEQSMQFKECPTLEFILEVELQGVQKQIGVRIKPPLLAHSARNGRRNVVKPSMAASMRLLYWYLKSRLEAAKFGLDDVFQTFMSKVMVSLPDGTVDTLGKVVEERPQVLRSLLPSFEIIPRPQLESKTEEDDSVVVEAVAEVEQ